jgi:hypothetical protein
MALVPCIYYLLEQNYKLNRQQNAACTHAKETPD